MLLSAYHLTIGYGNYVVQQDLSLQGDEGTMICMLGKNGCGKSTLLRTLAGLQMPIRGEVKVRLTNDLNDLGNLNNTGDLRDLTSLSATERAKLLSLVLTERLSIDNTTVHDVVAMGRYPYSSFLGGLTEDDEKQIQYSLQAVGIEEKTQHFFNSLSDGEKQRVLIAKALAQQTPIILLDEPTAHLDLNNRIRILLLLKQLAHEAGKCIIISTHELDLAMQIADTIWLMTPKRGIQTGTPEALIDSGAFQTAFEDDNFSFVNEGGLLKIRLSQK